MKKTVSYLLFCTLIFVISSCAEESSEANKDEAKSTVQPEVVEVIDTVPVTTVFLKIMGKENLIQGYYVESQTEEDFIRNSGEQTDFIKLVNVDIKGSPYAPDNEEQEFKENETGTIKSRLSVYNMLQLHTEEVDQPFRVSIVTKVKDYETWKWLYDMEAQNRENAGMKQLQLGINKDDSTEVFMLIAIPDIAKARELMEHPGLEKKMEQAGVIGKPIVKFWRPAGFQSEEI